MKKQLIPNTDFTRFALAIWRHNRLNGTLGSRPSGKYADRLITRIINKAIRDAKGDPNFTGPEFQNLNRKARYIMDDHLRMSWGDYSPYGFNTIDDVCANAIGALNMNIAGWFESEQSIGY